MDDFHNDPRQEVLFCIQQANKPVQRPSRQDPGQEHEELIVQPDGIDGLGPPLHGHPGNKRSGLGGVHAVLLVVLHPLDGPADAAAVHVVALHGFHPGGGEARVNVPRLHGAHRDAKGPQLVGQGHGIGVHRRLSGGVVRLEGNGAGRRHGAEVHDAAPARLAHMGDHGLVHPHHAEEVHVQQALGLRRVGELHRPGDAEARDNHQHVDAPGPVHDLRHGGADLVLVGNVAADVVQALHPLLPAAQLIHIIARIPQTQGRSLSDAGGPSGDDGDLTHDPSPARPP